MEGRVKCLRLCWIFGVAGLLALVAMTKVLTHSWTSHLMDSIMMILMVVLVLCLFEACWKPFAANDNDEDSVNSGDSDRESSTMANPLVYAEAPPSYEEILAQGQVEPPSSTSDGGQEAMSTKSTSALDIEEPATLNGSVSLPRRYSPFITDTLYSYASGSEVPLSVDGLPNYEQAVAVLQPGARTLFDPDTNHDLIMFI